jgi:D-glycerate 3-kinase
MMPRESIASVYGLLADRIGREAGACASTLVVGLCGPQGSGKSTLASTLQVLLQHHGITTAVLSLDDLYLPHAERVALAQQVHPLLRTRGVPGTHDVALGVRLVEALGQKGEIQLPVFDKASDERRPRAQWSRIAGPVRVVIFEGWCVGAVPQTDAALDIDANDLERDSDPDGRWRRYVNHALANDYQALFGRIDLLVLLEPPDFDVVYEWRAEQERELRKHIAASGGNASAVMTDAELRRFIAHYERLTKHILAEMPARADVLIELDAARVPVHVRFD